MGTLQLDDTIAAIATPPGEGAIGMVRMSGPAAQRIAAALFRPAGVGRHPSHRRWRSHRLYHGHIVDPAGDRVVDEVLLAYMRAPRSYTGQDVVEISGHGGGTSVREILRLVVAAGARPAERGEMTLRAFLAGRIDLAQAEAVADVVRARTPAALSLATRQLAGALSGAVGAIRHEVLAVFAQMEASIDFVEEDVPSVSVADVLVPLRRAAGQLDALLATARAGQLHREGFRVALVGCPNAGKSSLLNALLQSDRAIVTPIAGTTRDVIEETIDVEGIPVVLADTAGIVETDDPVERIGVERSLDTLRLADLAVLVIDRSTALSEGEAELCRMVGQQLASRPAIVVLAKADLPARTDMSDVLSVLPDVPVVQLSSHTGEGLGELRAVIQHTALGTSSAPSPVGHDAVVASARHRAALERARLAIQDAIRGLEHGVQLDLTCIDLRACVAALGEITGETVTDDLLTEIFSQFCIGK
jgi:tRNA modification GTPase